MKIEMHLPSGALGGSPTDNPLVSMLRDIASKASKDAEGEWAEKYGTPYANAVFVMHPFCWCEDADCPYCFWQTSIDDKPRDAPQEMRETFGNTADAPAPNFWYKPLDIKIWWYKYIGRGMEINKMLTLADVESMWERCLKSLDHDN